MYVVAGASGNTGKVVVQRLLEAGKQVRVISRSENHLSELIAQGAIPAVGDMTNPDFLKEAFRDTEGAYVLIPPKYDAPDFRAYQKEIAQNITNAVKANTVPYVVTLSSFGAHLKEGAGVVSGLYPLEQQLNALDDTQVVHLRAGYFYENFFGSIPVIQEQGVLGGFPIAGEVELDMIHAPDIGEAAADYLINKNINGKEVVLLSYQQAYTLNEAAKILGKAINKPDLTYVAFPPDGAKQAMVQMGFSESLAEQYVEFSRAASEGKLYSDNKGSKVKHTPTSLEYFSRIFAQAYQAQ